MKSINIIGDLIIATSRLTVTDIATVVRNKPDALRVFDADKVQVFAVSFNVGRPNLSKFGITFGGKSRCSNGYAMFTATIPNGTQDAKAFATDLFSPVAAHIEKIETQVSEAVAEIAKVRKKLTDTISVLDGDDSATTSNEN